MLCEIFQTQLWNATKFELREAERGNSIAILGQEKIQGTKVSLPYWSFLSLVQIIFAQFGSKENESSVSEKEK